MIKLLWPIGAGLLFISLGIIQKAYPYTFTSDFEIGYYWQSLPINFQLFVVDESEGPLLEELVEESLTEWNQSASYNIWTVTSGYSTGTPTGNFIRWSHNFAEETGFDESTTLAITIRYQNGAYINKTEIILNGNMDFLVENQGNVLKTTILHEIGHTLGLGHSEDDEAIMAPYLSSVDVLQEDDIAGINALLDETLERQRTGFVASSSAQSSEASDQEQSSTFSCGTIDIDESGPKGGNLLALCLGFLLTLSFGGSFFQGEVRVRR